MAPQLDYQDQDGALTQAIEGALVDAGFGDVVSRSAGANVAQVETLTVGTPVIAVAQTSRLTVDTAADGDVFTIQINGVVVATGTSAGTDATVQRDAIEALLLANAYFIANFTVVDQSTDALDITAIQDGEPFGVEETVDATSAWSFSEPVPNVVGTQMKATFNGVETHLAADTTVVATETAALLALLQAEAENIGIITFTAGGAGEIIATATVAGVSFTVAWVNETLNGVPGTPVLASVATVANVTGNPVPFGYGLAVGASSPLVVLPSITGFLFEGVARFKAKIAPNDGTGAKYEAGEAISVIKQGRVWVLAEEAVSLTDPVFLRHTIGSATELPGRFRRDADTARADQIPNGAARWVTETTGEGLAQLEINLP